MKKSLNGQHKRLIFFAAMNLISKRCHYCLGGDVTSRKEHQTASVEYIQSESGTEWKRHTIGNCKNKATPADIIVIFYLQLGSGAADICSMMKCSSVANKRVDFLARGGDAGPGCQIWTPDTLDGTRGGISHLLCSGARRVPRPARGRWMTHVSDCGAEVGGRDGRYQYKFIRGTEAST